MSLSNQAIRVVSINKKTINVQNIPTNRKDNVKELFSSRGTIYGQPHTHTRDSKRNDIQDNSTFTQFNPADILNTKSKVKVSELVDKFSSGGIDSFELKSELNKLNVNSNSLEVS